MDSETASNYQDYQDLTVYFSAAAMLVGRQEGRLDWKNPLQKSPHVPRWKPSLTWNNFWKGQLKPKVVVIAVVVALVIAVEAKMQSNLDYNIVLNNKIRTDETASMATSGENNIIVDTANAAKASKQ